MSTRRLIQTLIRRAVTELEGIAAGNPRLEAEYLMAAALGTDRLGFLRLGEEDPVPEEAIDQFEALLGRRLAREPLQYVLGSRPFCEIDLRVGPGVLIPRSETEVLVEIVSSWAAQSQWSVDSRKSDGSETSSSSGESAERSAGNEGPWLVDVGTGSGAILLSLLVRLSAWRGIGIETESDALEYARLNREWVAIIDDGAVKGSTLAAADPATVPARAWLVRGNLLDPVRSAPKPAVRSGNRQRSPIAIVAANLPYIATDELGDLAPEVRDHEPISALDGGADGLIWIRPLISSAAGILASGGLLALELGVGQTEQVADLLVAGDSYRDIEIYRDLTDRPRGILAIRK